MNIAEFKNCVQKNRNDNDTRMIFNHKRIKDLAFEAASLIVLDIVLDIFKLDKDAIEIIVLDGSIIDKVEWCISDEITKLKVPLNDEDITLPCGTPIPSDEIKQPCDLEKECRNINSKYSCQPLIITVNDILKYPFFFRKCKEHYKKLGIEFRLTNSNGSKWMINLSKLILSVDNY